MVCGHVAARITPRQGLAVKWSARFLVQPATTAGAERGYLFAGRRSFASAVAGSSVMTSRCSGRPRFLGLAVFLALVVFATLLMLKYLFRQKGPLM